MVRLNELEARIQERGPEFMYANEDVPIEKVIVDMMADHNWTLSARRATGGLVAETLTSIPGSASMFLGGIICYTNQIKEKLVHIPHALEGMMRREPSVRRLPKRLRIMSGW